MKKLMWIGLASLIIFAGCELVNRDFYLAENDFPDPGKGSLVLVFDGSELPTPKTIAPPFTDMDVARYEIRGSGPGGESFEYLNNTTGVLTENGLTPGAWTLSVEAVNSNDLIIGAIDGIILDTAPFTITQGVVTTLNQTIIPIIGTGTLGLTLNWPLGSVPIPSINATLTPYGSTSPEPLGFLPDPLVPTDVTASYPETSRNTGYYTLFLALNEDGILAWGHLEAVRILYQQTTARTFNLNMDAGGLYLESITFDDNNPVSITFTPDPLPLTLSKLDATPLSVTVTAVPVPGDTGNYNYTWYLDGSVISGETSAAITLLGSDYSVGEHNFTVLIDDTANGTLSSESFSIEIVD